MQRALDWVGLALTALLASAVALGLLSAGRAEGGFSALEGGVLVLSVPLGLVAADLVSGLVHWLADRVFSADTPGFGPYFVRPFREHHREPEAILRHDWVETLGSSCLGVAPLLAAALVALESGQPGPGPVRTAVGAFALSLAGWLCLTNQIHKWAHMAAPARWVAVLQRARLLLSASHHALHHTAPYDGRYCITTGWLNAPLDRLRLFARAERALSQCRRARLGGDESSRATLEQSI